MLTTWESKSYQSSCRISCIDCIGKMVSLGFGCGRIIVVGFVAKGFGGEDFPKFIMILVLIVGLLNPNP